LLLIAIAGAGTIPIIILMLFGFCGDDVIHAFKTLWQIYPSFIVGGVGGELIYAGLLLRSKRSLASPAASAEPSIGLQRLLKCATMR
jgi:hypothetical protein